MAPVEVGTLLAGKYRIEQLIGRGGMGSVWQAEHLEWGAPVAVKVLEFQVVGVDGQPVVLSSVPPALVQRFDAEARTAAAIRSPHVVQILDHGVDEGIGAPYIIMELLEGESLATRLERVGRLSAPETARVATHVARALTRLHEAGMVHRDLKPGNVFLVRNDDEELAKVLDFGIAKNRQSSVNDGVLTTTGQQLGTPFYMSPEQIRGQRGVDYRTDLWAFGVVAFECLTGRRPFEGETLGDLSLKICAEPIPLPSSVAPVPTGFDGWFLRSVSRDRALTFTSAREAAELLRGVLVTAQGQQRVTLTHDVNLSQSPGELNSPTVAAPLTAAATTAAPVSSAGSVSGSSFKKTHFRRAVLSAGVVVALLAGVGTWLRLRGPSPTLNDARVEPEYASDTPSAAVAPTNGRSRGDGADGPGLGVGPLAPSSAVSSTGPSDATFAASTPSASGESGEGPPRWGAKSKPPKARPASQAPAVSAVSRPTPARASPAAIQPAKTPPQNAQPTAAPLPGDLIEDRL